MYNKDLHKYYTTKYGPQNTGHWPRFKQKEPNLNQRATSHENMQNEPNQREKKSNDIFFKNSIVRNTLSSEDPLEVSLNSCKAVT
jgi:hypothetical protein